MSEEEAIRFLAEEAGFLVMRVDETQWWVDDRTIPVWELLRAIADVKENG